VNERLLVLVRHGESDLSSTDMLETPRGRQWDPPLSAKGMEQAALLAKRLIMMDPEPVAVVASPMQRARQTAEAYAELSGASVRFDDDLVEANIGGWEALPFEEIIASDDELLRTIREQKPIWNRAPGGERGPDFRRRVVGAVDRVLATHPEGDLLVFCHGGVINAYMGDVLGIEHEMFFLPENTSINTVVMDGSMRSLRFLNDIVHLSDPHWFEP
jgi:broad specificity phosphatase PhoE